MLRSRIQQYSTITWIVEKADFSLAFEESAKMKINKILLEYMQL